MTESCDFCLSYENFATNRALLTFCKTSFCTCCILTGNYNFCVSKSFTSCCATDCTCLSSCTCSFCPVVFTVCTVNNSCFATVCTFFCDFNESLAVAFCSGYFYPVVIVHITLDCQSSKDLVCNVFIASYRSINDVNVECVRNYYSVNCRVKCRNICYCEQCICNCKNFFSNNVFKNLRRNECCVDVSVTEKFANCECYFTDNDFGTEVVTVVVTKKSDCSFRVDFSNCVDCCSIFNVEGNVLIDSGFDSECNNVYEVDFDGVNGVFTEHFCQLSRVKVKKTVGVFRNKLSSFFNNVYRVGNCFKLACGSESFLKFCTERVNDSNVFFAKESSPVKSFNCLAFDSSLNFCVTFNCGETCFNEFNEVDTVCTDYRRELFVNCFNEVYCGFIVAVSKTEKLFNSKVNCACIIIFNCDEVSLFDEFSCYVFDSNNCVLISVQVENVCENFSIASFFSDSYIEEVFVKCDFASESVSEVETESCYDIFGSKFTAFDNLENCFDNSACCVNKTACFFHLFSYVVTDCFNNSCDFFRLRFYVIANDVGDVFKCKVFLNVESYSYSIFIYSVSCCELLANLSDNVFNSCVDFNNNAPNNFDLVLNLSLNLCNDCFYSFLNSSHSSFDCRDNYECVNIDTSLNSDSFNVSEVCVEIIFEFEDSSYQTVNCGSAACSENFLDFLQCCNCSSKFSCEFSLEFSCYAENAEVSIFNCIDSNFESFDSCCDVAFFFSILVCFSVSFIIVFKNQICSIVDKLKNVLESFSCCCVICFVSLNYGCIDTVVCSRCGMSGDTVTNLVHREETNERKHCFFFAEECCEFSLKCIRRKCSDSVVCSVNRIHCIAEPIVTSKSLESCCRIGIRSTVEDGSHVIEECANSAQLNFTGFQALNNCCFQRKINYDGECLYVITITGKYCTYKLRLNRIQSGRQQVSCIESPLVFTCFISSNFISCDSHSICIKTQQTACDHGSNEIRVCNNSLLTNNSTVNDTVTVFICAPTSCCDFIYDTSNHFGVFRLCSKEELCAVCLVESFACSCKSILNRFKCCFIVFLVNNREVVYESVNASVNSVFYIVGSRDSSHVCAECIVDLTHYRTEIEFETVTYNSHTFIGVKYANENNSCFGVVFSDPVNDSLVAEYEACCCVSCETAEYIKVEIFSCISGDNSHEFFHEHFVNFKNKFLVFFRLYKCECIFQSYLRMSFIITSTHYVECTHSSVNEECVEGCVTKSESNNVCVLDVCLIVILQNFNSFSICTIRIKRILSVECIVEANFEVTIYRKVCKAEQECQVFRTEARQCQLCVINCAILFKVLFELKCVRAFTIYLFACKEVITISLCTSLIITQEAVTISHRVTNGNIIDCFLCLAFSSGRSAYDRSHNANNHHDCHSNRKSFYKPILLNHCFVLSGSIVYHL